MDIHSFTEKSMRDKILDCEKEEEYSQLRENKFDIILHSEEFLGLAY